MPTYYCSMEMTGQLMETIQAHTRDRDNWLVVGVDEAGMQEMLSLAREYDLLGPLWSYLGQFRRRQRRMAGRRTRGPTAEPLADGGSSELRGPAQ